VGAYEDTIASLERLEVGGGWDLRLERVRAAMEVRGHPERRFASIHLAGTNGKGSTAAMLEAVLRAAGHRTGLYTSPHLVDFCERIRAGGRTIPRASVVALVAELRAALARHAIALTHFEFVTLLAFEWFARVGVEIAVVEVGLGGRLDATNVITPLVAAITHIGHDHEEHLGRGLAAIAAEKAGVAKRNVPLVLGRLAPEVGAVIERHAAAAAAPIVRAGVDTQLVAEDEGLLFRGRAGERWPGLRLALRGEFQRRNAEVALTALTAQDRFPCPPAAVRAGLAAVRWPGRLTVIEGTPLTILDGAHNPEGVAALTAELPRLVGDRRVVLVFAVMADKRWQDMLTTLAARIERGVVTRVGRRGLDPAALSAALAPHLAAVVVEDPRAAVRAARALCTPGDVLLVTGSLFLVGEAHRELAGHGGTILFGPWQGWERDGTGAAP
jgi:dihydrofolate synthase/folylpolyglutamate synthase